MPSFDKSFFVSFSGGADSTALLLWAVQRLQNVRAVHFEHGLRGEESLQDAAFCRAFCEERNIPIEVIPLNVPGNKLPGEGDEAAARRLRLFAWKKYLFGKDNAVVLLGHHAGDVVETLLQRLFRGSNASGLSSLREERVIDGIRFQRPLLHWTRADIESFLRENGVTRWCSDSTNAESEFLRNYLRNVILPPLYDKFPFAEHGILQAARALADDADFIESAVEEKYPACRDGDVAQWRKLHPALLPRVLRKFMSEFAHCDFLPNHNDIQRLSDALKKSCDHIRIPLSGGQFVLVLEYGKLSVENCMEDMVLPEPVVWNWRETSQVQYGTFTLAAELLTPPIVFDKGSRCAYFDANAMPDTIFVTTKREGDVILSFDGHRKSLKNLFINARIPIDERLKIPIVRLPDGTPIFIPNLQNSNFAPVTSVSTLVLRITIV